MHIGIHPGRKMNHRLRLEVTKTPAIAGGSYIRGALWTRYNSEQAARGQKSRRQNRGKPAMLAMDRSVKLASVFVAVSVLISCQPTAAWYKQATGPSYYSVGRASGLLSGIRRSPYIRRSEPELGTESAETPGSNFVSDLNGQPRQTSILKNMAICVKDISPNLQSCELLQDGTNTFQCKADVFLSLDSQDCANA